ncbi:MAG: HAD-IB family hydrolase [Flavobacteriaceae bacterium]
MKLVIFDFCETLVNFQTADVFVDYVLEQSGRGKSKITKILISVMYRLRLIALANKIFPGLNLSKRIHLYQLRGIPTQQMQLWSQNYVSEKIRPNLIPELVQKLREHQQAGDFVLLISGGYEDYLLEFAQQENIPVVMGTRIERKNNRLTGFFDGPDCLQQEKVNRLKDWLSNQNQLFGSSVLYSDSMTDMPLFEWVNHPVVVSKNKSQAWAQQHNFTEIIHA